MQKGVAWTKQEKSAYIDFISKNLKTIKSRVPHRFWINCSHQVATKSAKQCSDFFQNVKRYAQSENVYDLVRKMNSKFFGVTYQQPIIAQNGCTNEQKYAIVKRIEVKNVEDEICSRFLRCWNPNETIISSKEQGQIFVQGVKFMEKLSQIKTKNEQKTEMEDNYSQHQQINSESSSNNSMVDEKEQMSKKMKKQFKNQKKLAQSNQGWTTEQKIRLIVFIHTFRLYFQPFKTEHGNGLEGIYRLMSEYIQTREESRCKSFTKVLLSKHLTVQQCVQEVLKEICVSEQQLLQQVQKMEEFYNDLLSKESNAFNEISLDYKQNEDNELKIKHALEKNLKYSENKDQTIPNLPAKTTKQFNTTTNLIRCQIPITLIITLKRQSTIETFTENTQDQNKNNDNISRNVKKRQRKEKRQHFNQRQIQINKKRTSPHQEEKFELEKRRKPRKHHHWTLSENIKFTGILIMNINLINTFDKKQIRQFHHFVTQSLRTDKNFIQCLNHYESLLKKCGNCNSAIEKLCLKFGLSQEKVQDRKKVFKNENKYLIKLGKNSIRLHSLPQRISLQSTKNLNESITWEIYQSNPTIWMYLSKESEEKNVSNQQKEQSLIKNSLHSLFQPKAKTGYQQTNDKILTNIEIPLELAVSDNSFESLYEEATGLNGLKKQQDNAIIINCTENQITLISEIQQSYQFIVQRPEQKYS